MNIFGRTILFLGNISPLLLIIDIIYYPHYFLLLITITILFFIFNIYWYKILKDAKEANKTGNEILNISHLNDMGFLVISYFLTYTLSIPSVAIVGGIKGLLILLILLFIIYISLWNSKLLLYNPFLFLFGYKIYQIKTNAGAIGYLLLKKGPIEYEIKGEVKVIRIDDYIYLLKDSYEPADLN